MSTVPPCTSSILLLLCALDCWLLLFRICHNGSFPVQLSGASQPLLVQQQEWPQNDVQMSFKGRPNDPQMTPKHVTKCDKNSARARQKFSHQQVHVSGVSLLGSSSLLFDVWCHSWKQWFCADKIQRQLFYFWVFDNYSFISMQSFNVFLWRSINRSGFNFWDDDIFAGSDQSENKWVRT